MNGNRYGVLLIGGGQTHQENYARAFAADSRCRLVGLTDEPDVPPRRRTLNERLAAELAIPHIDDFDSAIRRDDVHIISVCVETERMGRVSTRAARAGKHLYVDKPFAATVDEAYQFVAAVREVGVRCQMFSLVHSAIARRARSFVESGRLGNLIGLHAEMFFAKGNAGSADLSQPRREKEQHGPLTFIDSKRELMTVGLYPLVMFLWLTGKQVIDVYGSTSNYFFEEHQGHDVEDFSCLLMGMESGIQATITVGRNGWCSHPGFGINQLRLVGTEQNAILDAFRPRLEIHSDALPWQPPPIPSAEDPMGFWSSTQEAAGMRAKQNWIAIEPSIKTDAVAFLDCIDDNRECEVTAEIGAHVLEIILGGYDSAASGRTVQLPARTISGPA